MLVIYQKNLIVILNKMTPAQLKYVRRLMQREGISFMESEYALQFSQGRTTQLENLFYHETQELIGTLVEPSSKSKMQRKILSMAHEMRWELPNGKVDMQRLNNWCVKHTPYHKPFNALTEAELPKVVSIYQKIYDAFLKGL